jgi:hypothetical protein
MSTIICKNCGVELEEDMLNCPLCGEPVTANGKVAIPAPGQQQAQAFPYTRKMNRPQKKFTWEIVSLILFSGIIATFIIDFILNKRITWSEYPVAVSLTIFSYISLFAFWQQRTLVQMAGGFILSSIFLVLLDSLTGYIVWAIKLGIPLLFSCNLVVSALIAIFRMSKYKGINLVAYAFLGASLLSVCVEGILSFFKTGLVHLEWSVIVAGCIVPVVLVIFFVYFRLKKARSLEKTFHI